MHSVNKGLLITVGGGLLIAIFTGSADYAARVARSGGPPFAGQADTAQALRDVATRIEQKIDANALEAKKGDLERRMDAAWAMVCAAKIGASKLTRDIVGYEIEIAQFQQQHIDLTRNTYPLTGCQ